MMEEIAMENASFFNGSEYQYVASILRGAFDIVAASGNEDKLLLDFIEALDNEDPILVRVP